MNHIQCFQIEKKAATVYTRDINLYIIPVFLNLYLSDKTMSAKFKKYVILKQIKLTAAKNTFAKNMYGYVINSKFSW